MDKYIGMHGIITDPDVSKNNPEALIEISLDEKGQKVFLRFACVFQRIEADSHERFSMRAHQA